MNKVKGIAVYVIGIMLMLYGVAMLFKSFNIGLFDWILLAAGVILLGVGLKQRNKNSISVAVFLIAIGMGVVLIAFRVLPENSLLETFYISTGIGLFAAYYIKNRESVFLYGSLAVSGIGIYFALSKIPFVRHSYLYGIVYLIIGMLLVILFLFEHKNFGFFPLVLSVLSYALGIENLLYVTNRISSTVYNTMFSVTFIVAGVFLVLFQKNSKKNKKIEKEIFNSSFKEDGNVD